MDFIKIVVIPSAISIGLMFGIIYLLSWNDCSNYQKITGRKTQIAALTCYVEYKNIMIPTKEYESRFIAYEKGK